MMGIRAENEIVVLTASREIIVGVIDDVVCADQARRGHVGRTAYGGHFRAERFGNLNCKRADASRRAIDEDMLTGFDLSLIAQSLKGSDGSYGYGCRLLERQSGRLEREAIFDGAGILGKPAQTSFCEGRTEYLVAGVKPRYVFADSFHPSGNIGAQDGVFWLEAFAYWGAGRTMVRASCTHRAD